MSVEFPGDLVVMALRLESQGVFERAGIPVLFTGVGKVNATHALTRRLADYRCAGLPPPHIINFGTAGSRLHGAGALIECRAFVQRDMDVSGLGVPLGTTPFEDIPARLEVSTTFAHLTQGVCASGDSFAMIACAPEADVIDMEAYALAKVCRLEQARFTAVKYVTDGADSAAANDWHSNFHRAADAFANLYRQFKINTGAGE